MQFSRQKLRIQSYQAVQQQGSLLIFNIYKHSRHLAKLLIVSKFKVGENFCNHFLTTSKIWRKVNKLISISIYVQVRVAGRS